MMFSGLPEHGLSPFGYTNASWTLKADLVSEFVCRLLNYMDANGFDTVEPQHPGNRVEERPFMDFTPGYCCAHSTHCYRSGSRAPWRLKQNYLLRHPADPARQDRRRGTAVRQTPCAGRGFGLAAVSLRRRRRCRRRRCRRSRPARTRRRRTRRRHLVGRRRFGALAGIGAQRLDADVERAQRRRVTHRAVDDQPGPAVVDAEARDEVADERACAGNRRRRSPVPRRYPARRAPISAARCPRSTSRS